MLRTVLFIAILSCISALQAQTLIRGTVLDAETNKPLPGTSVFVSNTRIGTVTASDGTYHLQLPQGKYEVIFSAVNFVTRVIPTNAVDSFTVVRMQPKVKELDEVVIRKYDPDGWRKWGQFFLDNFIGVNQFSEDCKLKNPKALRFYFDKKTNVMNATASEVLVIENKALGYILKYQMEDFTYDGRTKIVYYEGYPLFEEMKGSQRKEKRWAENRLEAYEGSQLHFMRALYRNRLIEEGFDVHHLKKVKSAEKERVRNVIRSGRRADSSLYYDRILSQPDEYDVMQAQVLTGDSVAYAVDSVTAGLTFPDYLDILYTKKEAHQKFMRLYPKARPGRESQVTLLNIDHVEVQADGSFYPTRNVLLLGYWSWSEKISAMLPFEYKPK